MKPIDSTAEILVFKSLGRNIDKKWIDWAYNMLLAGFETESLIILAGETEPFNQFEMQPLANQALHELGLTWDDGELVLKNYICYLVSEALNGKITADHVLSTLKNICMEQEYESLLYDFYLLYWAKDDLIYSENQWYWPGATRDNIDEMIMAYFVEWKKARNT